jgi:SM-20-related protein
MPPVFDMLDTIIDDLVRQGWSVVPDFISQQQVRQLALEARQLKLGDALNRAGIGKGAERTVNTEIRGDSILWLEESQLTAAQRDYLGQLEALRLAANAGLQLGLFDFEGHLAVYPPGSFYRKHLDRFQNDSLRTLTAILYLNEDWREEDGGQLRVYTGDDEYFDVLPQAGTLMTFLTDGLWHEVLPATRERISITGWFKTRGAALL